MNPFAALRHFLAGAVKQKPPKPHSDLDRRLLSDVAAHGCHVIKVLRSESTPPFAYSIGLFHSFAHPEVLLVGLDLDLMHRLINDIRDHIRAGALFSAGSRSSAILKGLDCEFRSVAPAHYPNLFGRAIWFYSGEDFPAVQCVWPDRQGRFPGQPDFDSTFRNIQPLYDQIA
jgi:hypothetical protein